MKTGAFWSNLTLREKIGLVRIDPVRQYRIFPDGPQMALSALQADISAVEPIAGTSATPATNHGLRRKLVAGDAIAALLVFVTALSTPGSTLPSLYRHPSLEHFTITVAGLSLAVAITLAALAAERLYLSRVSSMRTLEIARVGRVALFLAVTSIVGGKLIGEAHEARFPFLVAVFAFFILNTWRMIFRIWLANQRRAGRFTRAVLLIGANDEGHSLYRLLKSHTELGYRITGIVGKQSNFESQDFGDIPYLGEAGQLQRILESTQIQGAIVSGGALARPVLNRVVRQLLENEVHVHMSTGINGIDHRRLRSQSLAYEPMVYVERADLEPWQLAVKRVMDLSIASLVLLISSPLFIGGALLVKLHDRGPIFFRQKRVGRHGELFDILKLRSMCIDAEAKQKGLEAQNLRQGPLFKLARDPRVTPIGRILRATSIDELPQLINVLRGDMSLVGPRPALPHEVEKFDDALRARQNVMPGITGLWQVEGRDSPDFSLYQRFDIFYVENWSVFLDFSILVGTVRVVLVRAVQAFKREKARQGALASTTALLE